MQKRKVLNVRYLPMKMPNPMWLLVVPMLVEFWNSVAWITPVYITVWVFIFLLFVFAKLNEEPVDL